MPKYPRESVDFAEITVTVGEQVVTAGVEFALTPAPARPLVSDFTPAVILDGKTGMMIRDLTPGEYTAWWRYTGSNPELPVRELSEPVVID